jgi:GNAT superfamily N-acetyltransferase
MTFWSVWMGDEIAGCGALKRLDALRGEIKSMRVADNFLRRGVGRGILNHLIGEAQAMGMESLVGDRGFRGLHPGSAFVRERGDSGGAVRSMVMSTIHSACS